MKQILTLLLIMTQTIFSLNSLFNKTPKWATVGSTVTSTLYALWTFALTQNIFSTSGDIVTKVSGIFAVITLFWNMFGEKKQTDTNEQAKSQP